HDFADHAGGLDVALFWAQSHLCHLEQDASLYRLQAVARIGQCTRINNGVGVLQEGGFHFIGHVDIDDIFNEILWNLFRLLTSHYSVRPSFTVLGPELSILRVASGRNSKVPTILSL